MFNLEVILLMLFIIIGFTSKYFIYPQINEGKFYIVYIFCNIFLFIFLMYYLAAKMGAIFYLISILTFIFSQVILFGCHYFYLLNKLSKNNILGVKVENKFYSLYQAWKNNKHSVFNKNGILELRPYKFEFFKWDDIYEITGFELEANTIDTTVLLFEYGNNEEFKIAQNDENYKNITKMMEQKFPMISKEWPNHVFQAGGEPVTLYSYKTQVY